VPLHGHQLFEQPVEQSVEHVEHVPPLHGSQVWHSEVVQQLLTEQQPGANNPATAARKSLVRIFFRVIITVLFLSAHLIEQSIDGWMRITT
jgi:hypothetical protein